MVVGISGWPQLFSSNVKWITHPRKIPGHCSVYRAAQADFNVRGWQGRLRYTAPTALFFSCHVATRIRRETPAASSRAGDLRSETIMRWMRLPIPCRLSRELSQGCRRRCMEPDADLAQEKQSVENPAALSKPVAIAARFARRRQKKGLGVRIHQGHRNHQGRAGRRSTLFDRTGRLSRRRGQHQSHT